LNNKGVPVLCGGALRNIGVQPLLDAVVDYLPSPLDVPPVRLIDAKHETNSPAPPVMMPPLPHWLLRSFLTLYGPAGISQVYSGRVKVGSQVLNSTRDKRERIGRLLLMHANHREDITGADTGAIMPLWD